MRPDPLREALQWFGLLGAAFAWTGQFIVGLGTGYAVCGAGGSQWGIGATVWQMTLTASAGFVAVLAEAAAIWLFMDVRRVDNEPPAGRHVFFAYAAVPANVIFLALILASGVMAIFHLPCTQS